jgi:effector-binding domain-containing protein
MSIKKIGIGFGVLLTFVVIWYLGLKESDYTITFKVKAATGTIFQGIEEWTDSQQKSNKGNYIVLEKSNYDHITHKFIFKKALMTYKWEMNSINDSMTQVVVSVKDANHSLYNRLTAPFVNTDFKETQINKIKDFKEGLENHIKNFKVKIDGEGKSKEDFVAYITLNSVMQEKAQKMIRDDGLITGYLGQNAIPIIGKPYVEILKWDQKTEQLEFNYCFPIAKNTVYVENPMVKFKSIPALKGIMATYYGNFRTSDRAWFAILDYAKRKKIKLNAKPLEQFLANPFNGGEELSWQTKIIIPFE